MFVNVGKQMTFMPKTKNKNTRKRKTKPQPNYTHRDSSGMGWRFVGSRPVSALADSVMRDCGFAVP